MSPCADLKAQLQTCRERAGLADQRACYPSTAGLHELCYPIELAVKKCLSYSLCDTRDARAVYGDDASTHPRKYRIAANKRLVACLLKKRALRGPCDPNL